MAGDLHAHSEIAGDMHAQTRLKAGAHASFQARTDGWTLAYYGSYWLPNLACMDVITSN